MSEDCKKEKTKEYFELDKYKEINELAKECWELRNAGNTTEFNNKLNILWNMFYCETSKQLPKKDMDAEAIIVQAFAEQWGFKKKPDAKNGIPKWLRSVRAS